MAYLCASEGKDERGKMVKTLKKIIRFYVLNSAMSKMQW